MALTDTLGRSMTYLRISVTDRCNLRCLYCMPPQGVAPRMHEDILRYEEIERFVRAAAGLGVRKIRLTGGEPLVRKGLPDLVALLAQVPGIDDLALTTNAILLPRYAEALARAGLKRVNISLDTLQADKYTQITRGGQLADVFAGIAAAEQAGLTPIKLNTVVVRGLNDDELVDLARLTLAHPWHVRFIELMPLNSESATFEAGGMSTAEVQARLSAALGPLTPAPRQAGLSQAADGSGPAIYYRLPGAQGNLGFISAVSEHFCAQCNRLRLTADGRLRLCLFSEREVDFRALLRGGATLEELQRQLEAAILSKPTGHQLDRRIIPHDRTMSEIGG